MKTYFVLYKDGQEESIQASSVRVTSSLISFFKEETFVAAIAVSEIKRIGETKLSLGEMPQIALPGSGRAEFDQWWKEQVAPALSVANAN